MKKFDDMEFYLKHKISSSVDKKGVDKYKPRRSRYASK